MPKELDWDNYAPVESLARIFSLSKRRIQQLLRKLIDENKVEVVVGVFSPDSSNPFARPLYRRIK